jgi:DNA recombination protein RmuC
MIFLVLALQIFLLLLIGLVVFRQLKPTPDPELAAQLARFETYVRESVGELRRQTPEEAARTRKENGEAASALRAEVIGNIAVLGSTLREELDGFRADNKASADDLRRAVDGKMEAIVQRLSASGTDIRDQQIALGASIHGKLTELMRGNAEQQDRLRSSVEERLNVLNKSNAEKLEEMRVTVDEKLHATLQTRLTESFGQVTDQLTKVHAGLGEMSKLSSGVDDLSRLFTNVKSRGQFAEAMLDNLLKQMLAPNQFVRNAQVKPGTQESVEFAVKFPGPNGDVLLPIDSKFPRESWDRLETAYESGSAPEIAAARKVFESAIRIEAKRICSKYINEPVTTPNAVMFLPTEGLYAEVMRRDGLHDEIQQNCKVMIAGPSNLSAILTSFQMVFQLVNLQKKGTEVWNVLAAARNEFGKFEDLMKKMDDQVETVQNTIRKLGTRTRAINKTLRDVSCDAAQPELPLNGVRDHSHFEALVPVLAAATEDE